MDDTYTQSSTRIMMENSPLKKYILVYNLEKKNNFTAIDIKGMYTLTNKTHFEQNSSLHQKLRSVTICQSVFMLPKGNTEVAMLSHLEYVCD